ncbi:GntR family transcriptional regulator [Pseudomarimonas salicorniae]|uniref:GntR family transcriptional regulator n=1 Tax=Pseudomarimonas salicorniae TaxID=2933270 RepID=A0ABT0GLL1_9GAMM|nr:GntR family transcriptional regulator [Lysobacter sp. CAU 1642]MCK7594915.1 GntR family transcriptional regulator [Lysobacter sp. CAU 1642]
MDASLFRIQPSLPEPIYRQIADQVRRLVAGGQLQAGDALPSVREIAAAHAINPMTVSKAYSQLEAEGVLERLRGKGMVVAATARRPQPLAERLAQLDPLLHEVAQRAHDLELPGDEVLPRLRQLMEK